MGTGRDLSLGLALAALAAAALAMTQLLVRGDVASALLPLVAMAGLAALPTLARARGFTLVAALAFLLTVLDEPNNFAFNEWDAPTKVLGPLLFGKLSVLTGAPFLKVSPMELATLALAGWLAFRYGRSELRNAVSSRRFRVLALLALAVPAAAFAGVASGVLQGNDLGLALTQVRSLPFLGLWLYIGYVACRGAADVDTLAKALVAAALLKSLEGWWAFFVVYGMQMGSREYLMEHISSEQLATAMFLVAGVWWARRRHLGHDLAAATLLGVCVVPYFLNLRRASFLGVGLTLGLVPVIYWRKITRRQVLGGLAAGLIFAAAIAATWELPPPLGLVAYPLKRFFIKDQYSQLDYRDVENFNQYHALMQAPVLGQGFGKRLHMFLELVDLSEIYPLYDVLPHNNVLWLWSNVGPLGMAALGTVVAMAMATLLRLGRRTSDRRERLLAFVGWGMLVRWLVYAYADLGFVFYRLPALVGLVVGMAIKLLSPADVSAAKEAPVAARLIPS